MLCRIAAQLYCSNTSEKITKLFNLKKPSADCLPPPPPPRVPQPRATQPRTPSSRSPPQNGTPAPFAPDHHWRRSPYSREPHPPPSPSPAPHHWGRQYPHLSPPAPGFAR